MSTLKSEIIALNRRVAGLESQLAAAAQPRHQAAPEADNDGLPVGQYRDGFGLVRHKRDGSQVIDPDAGTDFERSFANARKRDAEIADERAERLAQGGFRAPWGTVYGTDGKSLEQAQREMDEELAAIRRGGGNPARRELEDAGAIKPHARALGD